MSNDINFTTTQEPVLSTTTPIPAIEKENTLNFSYRILLFLVSRFFLLFFGIFIGVGIVVKLNPETNNLKAQIKVLKEENENLKLLFKKQNTNWGEIKNSIILKK